MLKKFLFALVPMVMICSTSFAGDDLLDDLTVDSIQDASIAIEEPSMDLDVDQLAANAGDDAIEGAGDEAIEACFRSFGYRSYGGHYGGYNCYRPCYNYSSYGYGYGYGCQSYSTYYCYRPVTYYTPCYPVYTHYWGCY